MIDIEGCFLSNMEESEMQEHNVIFEPDFREWMSDKQFIIGYFNVIYSGIEVGDDVAIGNGNTIAANVKIGDGVRIGHNCIIEQDVQIGNNVILQGNIKIAAGSIVKDRCTLKHGTILTNNAILEENVFMGPNTITLGGNHKRETEHGTVIGQNCYIGAGTKIAANTQICQEVTTGANAFVNRNITVPGIYVGIPAKFLK